MAMQAREFLLIDVVVLPILIYALLGKLADSARALWSATSSPGIPPSSTREDRDAWPTALTA